MSNEKNFWSTLPGILAGIASIIAAITGLIVALHEIKSDRTERTDPGTTERTDPGTTERKYPFMPPGMAKLENYLREKEWKQADLETSSLIFKGSDSDASKVSCKDINQIDELWRKYSNGRFGFSIQSSIYLETGNPLGKYDKNAWRKFGDRVGWRVNGIWLESYEVLNLSLKAPKGHLPVFAGRYSGMRNINAITRAIECGM